MVDQNIFRYKFDNNVNEDMNCFAKLHEYDDRKTFKEAWEKWTNENMSIIMRETQRLNELGYKGNIIDKMYKSVRYYYRKKSNHKTEPKKRKKYISVDKELLEVMDEHIKKLINVSPAERFDDFCKNNTEIIMTEIKRLLENDMSSNDIKNKIKKTYKNRHFQLIKI